MGCAKSCVVKYFLVSVGGTSDFRIFYAKSQQIRIKFCATLKKGGEKLLYTNIRRLCKEKGIAISKMENDLEFPRSSISKWDNNEPGIRKVQKVADYLGVSIEKLLEDAPCCGTP